MNTQDWSPLGWTGWISLQTRESRVFSNTTVQKHQFFIVQLSHPYMTIGKTISLTRQTFVGKVMFLLFNTLSRLVIAFLPRSKHLLISWMQSPSAAEANICGMDKWNQIWANMSSWCSAEFWGIFVHDSKQVACTPGCSLENLVVCPQTGMELGFPPIGWWRRRNGLNSLKKKIIYFVCTGSLLLRAGFLEVRWVGATLCCGA